MLRKTKKVFTALVALAMVAALPACGSRSNDDSSGSTNTQAPATNNNTNNNNDNSGSESQNDSQDEVETEEPEVLRDLGGQEFLIGNWWGDWDTDSFEPKNASEEATLEWRTEIQEKYNFTMREVKVANWGEMQEIVSTSFMAGDPVAQIVIVEPSWFVSLNNQGLFYPVSDLPSVDLTSQTPVIWNRATHEATTVGGKTYGFSVGNPESGGIYFNKRLFEEAGLDPELPYDMQKEGTWDWEAFVDLCKKLTRDIDNDGINDTYALATFSSDIMQRIIASNKAQYVDKDAEGRLFNATGTPEFLQALQFSVRLYNEGVLMPQPEGTEWNWFDDAYMNGQAAMRSGGTYMASGFAENMADNWGFVLFPKGPNADDYTFHVTSNINAVAHSLSAQEADDLMFAFSLWSTPAPGYDSPDEWKTNAYSRYRDARAVDESVTRMRNDGNGYQPYHVFVPGLETGDIAWNMWFDGVDPAQLIEKVEQSWNAIIDEANGR